MSITFTRGWRTAGRHKIVSLIVIFLVAAAALALTVVLTFAAAPAGGEDHPAPYTVAPTQTLVNHAGCNRGRVVSFC
ncbi:MAG: hypothetical protein JWO57_932 [Pseudonocardiales bacterium]|nr:hypothetical protein [Pseudonocardiales bacterium]